MEEFIGNKENERRETPSSQGMEKVVGMRKLTRTGCIRKGSDQILRSDLEKLLLFLTELKKHGDSIVEPQNLSEVIEALNKDGTGDDFKGVLDSILEVLVLPGKIALVLKYYGAWEYIEISDDVDDVDVIEELTRSDYDILRQGILNPSGGAQEAFNSQGVVSHSGKAPSTKKNSTKRTKQ